MGIMGGNMKQQHMRRIWLALKMIFICVVIIYLVIYGNVGAPLEVGKQNYHIQSAAVISIGFATALCMFTHNNRQE